MSLLIALDPTKAVSEQQATAMQLANFCAGLFRRAESHISIKHGALDVCQKGAVLAVAIDLRDLLLTLPHGREALCNLGFKPVPQEFKGE